MQGLIHIWLRHRDIILEPHRHGGVHLVHHSEHRIAVLYRIDYDAHRKQVIKFVNGLALRVHLSEYTVEMLCPAHYGALYMHLVKLFAEYIHYIRYILVTRALFLIYALAYLLIRHRVEIFQRKILKLDLYF